MADKKQKFLYLTPAEQSKPGLDPSIKQEGYIDAAPIPLEGVSRVETPSDARSKSYLDYRQLRKEYYRDVKPMGMKGFLENPFVPLGAGTMLYYFVQAGLAKDDMTKFQYLSKRWHAHFFTIIALVGGIFYTQHKEDRWIKTTAKERGLTIHKEDFGA